MMNGTGTSTNEMIHVEAGSPASIANPSIARTPRLAGTRSQLLQSLDMASTDSLKGRQLSFHPETCSVLTFEGIQG
jgi:hypothetical protein